MGDGILLNDTPTLIHAVFCKNEPHGHRYAYISDWLAKNQGYNPETYSVPHIVEKLPKPAYDLREKIGIFDVNIRQTENQIILTNKTHEKHGLVFFNAIYVKGIRVMDGNGNTHVLKFTFM